MRIPSVDADSIARILKEGEFNAFTVEEWRYLILSLLGEMEIARKRYIQDSRLWFMSIFNLGDRDTGPEGAITLFLESDLPLRARANLSDACTQLAADAHGHARGSDEYRELLKELFEFAMSLWGVIDGWACADVALDRHMDDEVRQMAAFVLLDRDFRGTPPDEVWNQLEAELAQCPALAYAVIRHFASSDGWRALEVFTKFKPTKGFDEDMVRQELGEALSYIRTFESWQGQFYDLCHTLPLWAVGVVRRVAALKDDAQAFLTLMPLETQAELDF